MAFPSPFARPAVPTVAPAELAARLAAGENLQIVDVREPGEYAEGHVPGALLLPLGQLARRYRELDRHRPVMMVCRSGNRSGQATAALVQAGYTNVYNMSGGMLEWAGPVER